MTDDTTRTRFLGAIAAQLPVHRVIELHLFGAIRQGGMESGVAVIAVDPNEPVPADASTTPVAEAPAAAADTDAAAADMPESVESVEAVLDEPVIQADGQVASDAAEPAEGDAADAGDHAGYDAPVDDAPVGDVPAPRVPAPRYTVYTARYRHTLKGPDRGKWEASVTEEADAPLLTVDAVVRGVSRRSGEADETVRLSGDEFRAALPDPLPAPTRPPLAGRRG
ncbi:MAG: hypothetical protein JWN79_1256 [Gemmatimonadetes bacterium]|jgi:hypothetical protein|nr:hypothetical protein [Gemmatimonadota bacterium]